ncbi:MAG: beta-ketoacyl-ACP synthase II [Butyrivibrio sp.]|nr:beta-ketoacyl-ACP synthase II [Butyrivibrio sp.]
MRRVVITGMGTVNPVGNTVEEAWKNVKDGVCGIAPITHFEVTDPRVSLAAEVKNLDAGEFIDKKELKKMDAFCTYALIAADEAVADAGIDFGDDERSGIIISSGIGGIGVIENESIKCNEKGMDRTSPFLIPGAITNMAAGRIAIKYGIHGICECVVTACAGAGNAIGDAFRQIRDNYADVMLCGGTEGSITPLCVGGFNTMKALSRATDPNRASVPFDKERAGFVMGEGAGILVIEELEHAKARNAKIYGEIVGYASNCDAHHITAPLEDGSGAAKCMELALKDAGIKAEDIDYINAHGTSTPMNDKGETMAVKKAFGDHAYKLMMSSTKSMTGHLLGASGAIEAIFSTLALKDGFVPATINYQVPDEECDLDIVPNEGRKADITYAMSNSLGFGGHNVSLIFKKYTED